MFENGSPLDRRQFLSTIVAGVATAGLAHVPAAVAAESMDVPIAGSEQLDAALKKLSGRKYRQVFDAPRPNESLPVIWSWALLHTFNKLNVPDANVGCMVVLRHDAIAFAMNDALWAKYSLGERFKIEDKTTKAPAVRNVVTNIKAGDMPLPEMALEKMQARGVVFGVCNLAITVQSMMIGGAMNLNPEDVGKDMLAGLLPGIVPLPSGVYAVQRAQGAGFTYCFAG